MEVRGYRGEVGGERVEDQVEVEVQVESEE